MKVTQERLKELYDYDERGYLVSKFATKRRPIGYLVGSKPQQHYYRLFIDGYSHILHRVIYLWHHGTYPAYVDHINRNIFDNRIENLRAATGAESAANRSKRPGRSSKWMGVVWDKDRGKWRAQININNLSRNLGRYDEEGDAAMIWNEVAYDTWGEFAVLNNSEENL